MFFDSNSKVISTKMGDFVSYMVCAPYVVVLLIEHLHSSVTWQGISVDIKNMCKDEIWLCAQI